MDLVIDNVPQHGTTSLVEVVTERRAKQQHVKKLQPHATGTVFRVL